MAHGLHSPPPQSTSVSLPSVCVFSQPGGSSSLASTARSGSAAASAPVSVGIGSFWQPTRSHPARSHEVLISQSPRALSRFLYTVDYHKFCAVVQLEANGGRERVARNGRAATPIA